MNEYIKIFSGASLPVFFTRDWHPRNHLSFKENGGPWPPHCVMDTSGAMFPQELLMPADNKHIISNGMKNEIDAYSAFQDTQLTAVLREQGIRRLYIGGLATDYCVKNTVLGALKLGFEAVLLMDAIQGIDINSGDSEKAVKQMLCAGAIGITIQDCISEMVQANN
ncbi:MAG: isochorismatase family protein [Negativicutes bacterium]